jgi:hypothetical protein
VPLYIICMRLGPSIPGVYVNPGFWTPKIRVLHARATVTAACCCVRKRCGGRVVVVGNQVKETKQLVMTSSRHHHPLHSIFFKFLSNSIESGVGPKMKVAQNLKTYNFAFGTNPRFCPHLEI